jgi:predicted metal-dependent hydrolase
MWNIGTNNIIIRESSEKSQYTSYTVNKGEQIIFCIRSKLIDKYINSSNIHDKNLIMYVALHEIAHIACPEYGHTPLFKDIFNFFCDEANKAGIYKKIDFKTTPMEYCGMTIT